LTLRSAVVGQELGRRDCKWHEGDSAFLTLESLVILDASSLSALKRLLGDVQCFPRGSISINCTNVCTAPELGAFLQVVIHPLHSRGLRDFELRMDDEWDIRRAYDIPLETLQYAKNKFAC